MEELEQLIIAECAKEETVLDATQLGSLLVNIANSRSKLNGFQKKQLVDFEEKIANDLQAYLDQDIPMMISALIKLRHIPSTLIDALLKEDNISTF